MDVGDVVLVTLQKAQRDDTAYDGREESLPDAAPDDEDEEEGGGGYVQNLVANPHHHVVVLVDEAHRGNDKWQHARWRAMLPRAAFVGFTGTPVISSNRKCSEEIFGPYADTYTLRDAELDRWLELPRSRSAAADAGPLVEWYSSRGERWLAARLPPLAALTGVRRPAGVETRDLGRRWGACSPEGAVSVHWAVMQLPVGLVDLVLIHELCHLKHPGHGAAFRRAVRLALPDADTRERQFAREEPQLWRGAVSS